MLGTLDRDLGEARVICDLFVVGGSIDLGIDASFKVGDFFGALVDKEHDDVTFGMIL